MAAERRTGRVIEWTTLSEGLATFRVSPETGTSFPSYTAGQYCALARTGCRLTKREPGEDGKPRYVPDLDENGVQKRGIVTHSYSIASAPFETETKGPLEFYVILEKDEKGNPGRLTESLFEIRPSFDDEITYVSRIVGDFTLERRAAGARHVVMVGTGTGLAPFRSIVMQMDEEARQGRTPSQRFTLLHANHSRPALAYHDELLAIEAAGRFDFAYVASESRPKGAAASADVGRGRASNMLRQIVDLKTKEAEEGKQPAVEPELPTRHSLESLRRRFVPSETVVLTCGSPGAMGDVALVASRLGMRFEKEDW